MKARAAPPSTLSTVRRVCLSQFHSDPLCIDFTAERACMYKGKAGRAKLIEQSSTSSLLPLSNSRRSSWPIISRTRPCRTVECKYYTSSPFFPARCLHHYAALIRPSRPTTHDPCRVPRLPLPVEQSVRQVLTKAAKFPNPKTSIPDCPNTSSRTSPPSSISSVPSPPLPRPLQMTPLKAVCSCWPYKKAPSSSPGS